MKVKELIKALSEQPQDAEVLIDLNNGSISEITKIVHALSAEELKDLIDEECVIIQSAKEVEE